MLSLEDQGRRLPLSPATLSFLRREALAVRATRDSASKIEPDRVDNPFLLLLQDERAGLLEFDKPAEPHKEVVVNNFPAETRE